MAGHRILAYRYFLHFAVISGWRIYGFKRRQRSNIRQSQLLQVRQLQARHPLQNMSQCMGTFISETFGIRCFTDTHTIQHNKSDSFK
ncbi:hypothetical protein D3C81_2194620 [compost metagenome]